MIRLNNVVKKYQGFTLNVSMEISKGRITGLIGKNGAGKSTIYKILLSLIRMDDGEVIMDECGHEDIGTVIADSFFSSYLNIRSIRKIMKESYKRFDEEYFNEKVKEGNLDENKPVREFSFGMKARLKMICALSHNARILLLDEPTLGLDVIARDEILDMIRDYMSRHEDTTVLISSHISDDLKHLSDDIYMIDDGKIILHEDTDVLLDDYAIIKTDEKGYQNIDKSYVVKTLNEYGSYSMLVKEKQYYLDNYKNTVIENAGIDNVIYMMIKGK